MNSATKKIAFTAMFAALTAVFTLISVPLPGGYYNFGDVAIFVAAFTLNPVLSAISGGLGGALGDLILGYTPYAPFTFVIKAVEATVASLLIHAAKKYFERRPLNRLLRTVTGFSCNLAGGLLMAGGYFVAEGLLLSAEKWSGGIVNLPWNVLQGVVSSLIAAVILFAFGLDRVLKKYAVSKDKDGRKTDVSDDGTDGNDAQS